MGRVVRCTIEMDMVEGQHLIPNNLSDEAQLRKEAEERFLHFVAYYIAGGEITPYVQSRIIADGEAS